MKANGDIPTNLEFDIRHINGVRSDNRIANLELYCTNPLYAIRHINGDPTDNRQSNLEVYKIDDQS